MTIEKDMTKILHKEIDQIAIRDDVDYDGPYSDAVHHRMIDTILGHGNLEKLLEDFLDQPVDIVSEYPIEHRILLGSYTPMHSPGIVALYENNIRNFFWRAVNEVLLANRNIFVSKNDLKHSAELVVLKVWWHELFHFSCDVFRQLFGSKFDSMTEEALAVAYSRLKMLELRSSGKSKISRIQPLFFSEMLQRIYSYTSPGYRDWPRYGDAARFDDGVSDYVLPHGNKLKLSGVDIFKMLKDMLTSLTSVPENGYVEKLV
ncbi:hypothetical protein [Desulfonatronovibrio magnus]|uniref:hypothetical protein n=1 Tax=Desulfonatronovibrio magnus TaxID=698827 RepID=UPI0005EB47D2|nr:hypothetical protein [Desulfonatronovibrio magnus]